MQKSLEFEPVEHTDYIYEIVGVNWLLVVGVFAVVTAAALWWRRRRHSRNSDTDL